jgi:hypothetical protein
MENQVPTGSNCDCHHILLLYPNVTIHLSSPQLYFIEEHNGELRMEKSIVTLESTNAGMELSFPINAQNNLPLALPIPMDSGFTTFDFYDNE